MTDHPSTQPGAGLLPCPFCGEDDAFVEQSTFASSYVICNNCSARGPDSCQESDDEEEPGRDAAIAAWNTSAPSSLALDREKVAEAHIGDPCSRCHMLHDEVPIGRCLAAADDDPIRRGDAFAVAQIALEGDSKDIRNALHIGIADIPALALAQPSASSGEGDMRERAAKVLYNRAGEWRSAMIGLTPQQAMRHSAIIDELHVLGERIRALPSTPSGEGA